MSYWMENANRLQNGFVVGAADSRRAWKNARRSERAARGGRRRSMQPVPAKAGNGVGNRTTEITTAAGITTTDSLGYPATSNKIANMTRAAATLRTFVHDAGGNITSDTRSGTAYAYTYNNRNRLATVTASLKG
jgi:YD repeat-containing protein